MISLLVKFFNLNSLKSAGTFVIFLAIFGFLIYFSSLLKGYNNSISKLENINTNLNDQLQRQNDEIKAKDEFINEKKQITIRKAINRSAPTSDNLSWLQSNRCKDC
jgi:predicted PurR-regulated permease PerM